MEPNSGESGSSLHGPEKPQKVPTGTSSLLGDKTLVEKSKNSSLSLGKASLTSETKYNKRDVKHIHQKSLQNKPNCFPFSTHYPTRMNNNSYKDRNHTIFGKEPKPNLRI